MPIYDYVCEAGHRVEVRHGVHAEGPTVCEVCGRPLRKAVSAPAIVFKGSGWAKVDARKAPAKSSSSSTDGGSADSEKSGGSEKPGDKPASPPAKATGADTSSPSTDGKSSTSD